MSAPNAPRKQMQLKVACELFAKSQISPSVVTYGMSIVNFTSITSTNIIVSNIDDIIALLFIRC